MFAVFFKVCIIFRELTDALPRPQKAAASVPTFCGRDVVPLSPAVREANRRH